MRTIKTTSANGNYIDRGKQYLAENTRKVVEAKLQYGINLVTVKAENLNPNDKKTNGLKNYRVRVNDVFSDTQQGKRKDGYKLLVFQNSKINYIQEGTKFYFYNSVWIADNPSNLTKVTGQTTVRQCIANRNTLDYYGNIVSEPFAIDKELSSTSGNSNTYMDSVSGNLACLMQLNENTKNIKNNDRILMGGQAFQIIGLDNYTQEFTNDSNSVRKLKFNLKLIEPTENDDIENNIVDGKLNSWEIKTNVKSIETKVGSVSKIIAKAFRGGDIPKQPYSIKFKSLNSEIVEINETNGEYTAISEGQTTIRCYLFENEKVFIDINIDVGLSDTFEVRFDKNIPFIRQYESVLIVAHVIKNGVKENDEAIDFSISGTQGMYQVNNVDSNSIRVTCLFPDSNSPIIVVAKKIIDGVEYSSTQKIWLESI